MTMLGLLLKSFEIPSFRIFTVTRFLVPDITFNSPICIIDDNFLSAGSAANLANVVAMKSFFPTSTNKEKTFKF